MMRLARISEVSQVQCEAEKISKSFSRLSLKRSNSQNCIGQFKNENDVSISNITQQDQQSMFGGLLENFPDIGRTVYDIDMDEELNLFSPQVAKIDQVQKGEPQDLTFEFDQNSHCHDKESLDLNESSIKINNVSGTHMLESGSDVKFYQALVINAMSPERSNVLDRAFLLQESSVFQSNRAMRNVPHPDLVPRNLLSSLKKELAEEDER